MKKIVSYLIALIFLCSCSQENAKFVLDQKTGSGLSSQSEKHTAEKQPISNVTTPFSSESEKEFSPATTPFSFKSEEVFSPNSESVPIENSDISETIYSHVIISEEKPLGNRTDVTILNEFMEKGFDFSQAGKTKNEILEGLIEQNIVCFNIFWRNDLITEKEELPNGSYHIKHLLFKSSDEIESLLLHTYTRETAEKWLKTNYPKEERAYYNDNEYLVWNPNECPLYYPFYPFKYGYDFEIIQFTEEVCSFVLYISVLDCTSDDWYLENTLIRYGIPCCAVFVDGEWRLTELVFGGMLTPNGLDVDEEGHLR